MNTERKRLVLSKDLSMWNWTTDHEGDNITRYERMNSYIIRTWNLLCTDTVGCKMLFARSLSKAFLA